MNNILNVIVVDDERIAREIMETYIAKTPNVMLSGSFNNGLEALQFVENNPVDIVLLDIHMPDMDGFSVIDFLPKAVKVIFTTAHRAYALKGFEVNALDYLLKPISYDRFFKSIKKYNPINPTLESPPYNLSSPFIFVRSERKMQKVTLTDINYVESFSDYLKIHTSKGLIVTRETITYLASKLPKQSFLRCHRSYIVALDKMCAYTHEHIELDRVTIPISRSYKADVLAFLERI